MQREDRILVEQELYNEERQKNELSVDGALVAETKSPHCPQAENEPNMKVRVSS
jgi:hypothetical protein